MPNEQLYSQVKAMLDLVAIGQFEALVRGAVRSRMSAAELKAIVLEYGRKPIRPPDSFVRQVPVVPIDHAQPEAWAVYAPLWTEEEGRSDLTLDVTIILLGDGVAYEINDLHVL